ncbi:MAG TPA: hypothetical protein GX510_07910 [Firmicutes bacterium]|nr:hypothetical protein [Candidatus Fermentithermobacillaceae bacterium]
MSRVLRLKRDARAGILIPIVAMPAPPQGGLTESLREKALSGLIDAVEEHGDMPAAADLEEASRAARAVLEEAKRAADEIIESARREAQNILESAAREREEVLQRAHREGYEAGYKEGLEDAATEGESLLLQAREALEDARSSLPVMLKELEPRILALCLEIGRKVLGRELREDPETILDMARQGLKALKDEREFSLRVNPSLVALLDGSKDELIAEFSAKSFEVIGDEEIPPDGVVVKSPHGLVDARIETQITNIARAIGELRQKAAALGEGVDEGVRPGEEPHF